MVQPDAAETGGFGIEDYLAGCSRAVPSSIATYRKRLTTCEGLLGKPLAEATPRDLADLKTKLYNKRSGSIYGKDLKAFYTRMGHPELAALCLLKQKRGRLDRTDLLSLDEVNRLLAAAGMLRDRAALAMLWVTGQRVGAVLSLRLRDVTELPPEDGGPGLRVFFWKVKVDGRQHVGYVFDEDGADHIRAWIRAYPYARTADAPLFACMAGVGLKPDSFRDLLPVLARKAGITKRVWPHLFRHSRATYLRLAGVPPESVKMLLGWSQRSHVLEDSYEHLVTTDARDDLLRAHGRPIPRNLNLGRLAAAEGELKPVVPLIESKSRVPIVDALTELRNLADEDPRVRQALDLLLGSVRQPAPA